jgi:hypothetical protein
MELYKDHANKIEFTNPDPHGQVLAAVSFNGESLPAAPTNLGNGKFELTLPWVATSGVFTVTWQFSVTGRGILTKTETHNVVVPLVEVNELRQELELPDVTDDHLMMQERRVRKIIEAHCGQSFDSSLEYRVVRGSGDQYLRLPKRIISGGSLVDTRLAVPWVGFSIRDDGWSLRRENGYYYDIVTTTAPIYAPSERIGSYWPNGVEWNISGLWGWESVPAAVREAALVLIEQRMCGQSYRDNYMSRVRASDWQFDYFQEANLGTGNVVADKLLEPFIVVRAAVI